MRDRIATLAAVVVLSTGIGFLAGQSGSEPADASGASATSDAAIVKELKKLNKNIGKSASDRGTVRGLLGEVCQNQTGSGSSCGR